MFINYYQLNDELYTYESLQKGCNFENVANGRKGAIIVRPMDGTVPIIRSTTEYKLPATIFSETIDNLIKKIKETVTIENIEFNNAMVEVYNNKYKSMGYHSDLSLDLSDNSYICIFSYYNNGHKTRSIRKLVSRNKEQLNKESYIKMNHNSLIVFNTQFNENFQHKIILDQNFENDDEWLGITLRLSKTYIKFVNERPYFSSNDEELVIADHENLKEFRTFRTIENKTKSFKYPKINYTISISDLYNIGSL